MATGFARHGTLNGVKSKDGVEGSGGRAAYGKLVETLRRLADSLDEVRNGISFFLACVARLRYHYVTWILGPEQKRYG